MKRGPYKAKPIPGSFADLIIRFRSSPRYRGWSPRHQLLNDRLLDAFRGANGRYMVEELRRGDVIAMRDEMAGKPGAARNWLKCIRLLLDYAVDLEWIKVNPARGVPDLPPRHREGYRTWRDDEIAQFLAHHPLGTTPHLALQLMLCTGAGPGDAVKLGPFNLRGDRLTYRRAKTRGVQDVEINVPILPDLAAALAQAPAGATYLAVDGRQRSARGLLNSVHRWCGQAGLGDRDDLERLLSPHGLRKAMGRRLAQAGCSPNEIMSWLGHSDLKQVTTYTKAYDRARAADSAVERLGMAKPENVVRMKK